MLLLVLLLLVLLLLSLRPAAARALRFAPTAVSITAFNLKKKSSRRSSSIGGKRQSYGAASRSVGE
jgi:hypothetical protein